MFKAFREFFQAREKRNNSEKIMMMIMIVVILMDDYDAVVSISLQFFSVLKGIVDVTIASTTTRLGKHSTFFVPSGEHFLSTFKPTSQKMFICL